MKNIARKILSFALAALLVLSISAPAFAETLLVGVPDDGTNLSRAIKLLETAGLVPSRDALLIEKQSEDGSNPYVNIIVARTEDAENETYKTIVEAFQTQLVAEVLLVNYKETFYPAFDYDAEAEFTVTEETVQEIIEYQSSSEGKTVVKLGVCGANNDQWKAVQKILDEQEAVIYIELVEFDAYNLPNEALNSGEIDLNSFQHKAYLESDSAQNGYDLTVIGDTLIAPLSLYSKNYESIDALKEAAGLLG